MTTDKTPGDDLPDISITGRIKGLRGENGREPRGKFQATDWLDDISTSADFPVVQVQFKNTRMGFFSNPSHINLQPGDIVAVEASPGHDIGSVVMVGPLVRMQMRKARVNPDSEFKRIFRKARPADIERFEEARAREHSTMIRSRVIAEELGLNMKIGDVEYQGDGGKAIFYYIADERVDFRKLIRILADEFKVRIEMKQIGARQEAGRIGGIGPCGRPLCCSSWMNHFVSVGTGAARVQDLSMNPQKLAGQCAKLKCCLNFELDTYAESAKKLPGRDIVLQTADADYYLFKSDILSRMVTYSTDRRTPTNAVTIPASRAFEIIALNKQGVKPEELDPEARQRKEEAPKEYIDLTDQDSLTRFDKAKRKKKKKSSAKAPQPKSEGQKSQPKGDTQKASQPKGDSQKTSQPKGDAQRPVRPKGERPKGKGDGRGPAPQPRQKAKAPRPQKPQSDNEKQPD